MKKIITEVFKRPNDWLSIMFYCVKEDGQVDSATTNTLLELVELSHPHEDQLEELVLLAEADRYVSPNPALPDWGVNDINIWLGAPMARPGHVCIANENTGDYSSEEGGVPQQFTYEQFKVAMKHWRKFRDHIATDGKENLLGQRYEVVLP